MIFPIENGQFSIHDRFFQDLAGQPTVQEMLAAKETGGEDGDCCSKKNHWIPRWIPGESPDIGLDMGLLMLAIERYKYIHILHIYILYMHTQRDIGWERL